MLSVMMSLLVKMAPGCTLCLDRLSRPGKTATVLCECLGSRPVDQRQQVRRLEKKPRLLSRAGACSKVALLLKKGATWAACQRTIVNTINLCPSSPVVKTDVCSILLTSRFARVQAAGIEVWTDEGNEDIDGRIAGCAQFKNVRTCSEQI
jgi:hypothetical protein